MKQFIITTKYKYDERYFFSGMIKDCYYALISGGTFTRLYLNYYYFKYEFNLKLNNEKQIYYIC